MNYCSRSNNLTPLDIEGLKTLYEIEDDIPDVEEPSDEEEPEDDDQTDDSENPEDDETDDADDSENPKGSASCQLGGRVVEHGDSIGFFFIRLQCNDGSWEYRF